MNSAAARRMSVLLALLGACASAPRQRPPLKTPALSTAAVPKQEHVSKAADPTSTSAEASTGPRMLDAAPADLPPQIAEHVAFLSDICPVALHYDSELGSGVVAGCRTCPPFEGPGAAPDGKIAVDGEDFFQLELLVSGHFTRAQADQRLAVFNGCEPHSDNWGGSVLAESSAGHFKSLSYASGIRPQRCKPYRRSDGRDLALCEFTDAHQALGTDSLASLDFSAAPPKMQELLSLASYDGCSAEAGATRAIDESISDFEFGTQAVKSSILTVHVERITHALNAEYAKYCERRAESETPIEPPPAKREHLLHRFRYDGRVFIAN